MSATPLPDKWIRKAIYDRIHNIEVDTLTIPCFDYQTTRKQPQHYILLTTQTAQYEDKTKCGHAWRSSILIDIVTRYGATGNTGSRLLADNIADEILTELNDINLDPLSNLSISSKTINFENDLAMETGTENIFRKLMRYEFIIN